MGLIVLYVAQGVAKGLIQDSLQNIQYVKAELQEATESSAAMATA